MVADIDRAAMLGDDPADDGEPEPAAPPLGGVVRQKELLALRWRNAGAVIGHDKADEPVRRIELGLEDDVAAALHRFDRVVDQVDDDAADLFGIQPDERKARRKALLDADIAEDAVVERDRVRDELGEVGRDRSRRRHPRELRKFVHQSLERFDLADDGLRALVDERFGGRRRA